jgi:hypothetical protein
MLSELILDHDLATIPSHRSHYHATSVKLLSTSFALRHFGYRLIACPLFLETALFRINDSPGRCLDDPTTSSNLAAALTFDRPCSEPRKQTSNPNAG